MYQIVKKVDLAPDIKLIKIFAPDIANKAQAGQFVIVRLHERAERIPLTIADCDKKEGLITIVFKVVGRSTEELGSLGEGKCVRNLCGPLGCPSEINYYGRVVCIGGGVGIAAIFPIAKALKEARNEVLSVLGARSAQFIIFEDEMAKVSDELYIVTDDGSKGRKGTVVDMLSDIIQRGEDIDFVYTVGSVAMMAAVAKATKLFGIRTVASLNPIMVDGTGMCGACRVVINGQTKFACLDGPDFDAHKVDFQMLLNRQKMFEKEEEFAKRYSQRV